MWIIAKDERDEKRMKKSDLLFTYIWFEKCAGNVKEKFEGIYKAKKIYDNSFKIMGNDEKNCRFLKRAEKKIS